MITITRNDFKNKGFLIKSNKVSNNYIYFIFLYHAEEDSNPGRQKVVNIKKCCPTGSVLGLY